MSSRIGLPRLAKHIVLLQARRKSRGLRARVFSERGETILE